MFDWLFGNPEKNEAASRIQAAWRGRKERSVIERMRPQLEAEKRARERAAAKIGAHFRGTRTRAEVSVLKGEKQFTDAQTKSGILEKRSARRSFVLGSRQVVLWQRKHVRIDDFHFCYSNKDHKKNDPKREEKRIPLMSITDILTVEGMDEFILVTGDTQYHFHCASAVENQSWINTVSLLQAYLREQGRAAASQRARV